MRNNHGGLTMHKKHHGEHHHHRKGEMEHHKHREHHKSAHHSKMASMHHEHPSLHEIKDSHQQGIERVKMRHGELEVGQHGKMGMHHKHHR
jgi:hypothetical protein